jgi:hypothetical protein
LPPPTPAAGQEPVNPLESSAKPDKKLRYSARAKQPKKLKVKGPQPDKMAPAAPDAAEAADRQTQAGPLGLAGDTASKKKRKSTTTGDKTRLTDKNKKPAASATGDVPLAAAPQTPAATPAPQQ